MQHIYIHTPFCLKKCPYCDFYSIGGKIDNSVFSSYANALIKEISFFAKTNNSHIKTLYFGGGTPSFLPLEIFDKIFSSLKNNFNINSNTEITLEVNPGNHLPLKEYKKLGINRISIGAQSFNDEELKDLGRIHNSQLIEKTYFDAKKLGFENISLDLMVGIPNQTKDKLNFSLDKALLLNPKHISLYMLTYYRDTQFYKKMKNGKIQKIDDDFEADLLDYAVEKLVKHGYNRYEISNFSKPSFESKHNLNTWDFGDYLGFGASAHSKLSNKRWSNEADIKNYIAQMNINPKSCFDTNYEKISDIDKINEIIMLSLRTRKGLDFDFFYSHTKENFIDICKSGIKKYKQTEFVKISKKNISLTDKGFNLYGYIVPDFLI